MAQMSPLPNIKTPESDSSEQPTLPTKDTSKMAAYSFPKNSLATTC